LKILITGGSGFIGSHLVRKWLEAGHALRVFDNGMRGKLRRLEGVYSDVEYIQGDVRDFESILKATKGVDAVAHLAYINGTEFFYTKPELVLEIALKGLINTVDACIQNEVPKYWLMSSSEVYQTPDMVPTDESISLKVPDPLNPRYSYGGGKIISELYAINYGRKYFENVSIVRPHNVYGPDMGWEHVIPQFITRAYDQIKVHSHGGLPFKIQGDGMQTRAFCYIDDFVEGCNLAFTKGEHMGVYHVGAMDEVKIISLAESIISHFSRYPSFEFIGEPEGQTQRRCPDIAKVQKLGYSPKISLVDGLDNTIKWYVENINLRSTNTFSAS